MSSLQDPHFSFVASGFPQDTFFVVRFQGNESLSRPYEFDLTLVSRNLDIVAETLLRANCTLQLHREKGAPLPIHGRPILFEQLQEHKGLGFYRLKMAPRLWWLNYTLHHQVFLDQTLPQILEAVLKDGGLSSQDYEFRLQGSYESLEFVCQYGESYLDFLDRWCQEWGIYYFFEQGGNQEKAIFTDSKASHILRPGCDKLRYAPVTGLESFRLQDSLRSFSSRNRPLPASVFLRDFNDQKPSLDVQGETEVDGQGLGRLYHFGGNLTSPAFAQRLAKLRKEEWLSRKEEYLSEGSAPSLAPGFLFELEGHFRKDFNRSYLCLEVQHEGDQTGFLLSGLQLDLGPQENQLYYRAGATAIPASTQFRTARIVPKPRLAGCLNARIDASGSGQYAELDNQGRYKVLLPFDLSGRKDGKASAWIRMAQPYAGEGHGMHFPLHKGTEVLLSFLEGDPDRPVISAAIPNKEKPSIIQDKNATMSGIQSAGGNHLVFQDQEGKQAAMLYSPYHNSALILGADPNGASDGKCEVTNGNTTSFVNGMSCETQMGDTNSFQFGWESSWHMGGGSISFVGGWDYSIEMGPKAYQLPECGGFMGTMSKILNWPLFGFGLLNGGKTVKVGVCRDTIEMGYGDCSVLHLYKENELGGLDSLVLKGGVSPVVETAVSAIGKAVLTTFGTHFAMLATGVVKSFLGYFGDSGKPFQALDEAQSYKIAETKSFGWFSNIPMLGTWSWYRLGSFALRTCLNAWVSSATKTYLQASEGETAVAGKIVLEKDGVKIHSCIADPTHPNAAIQLKAKGNPGSSEAKFDLKPNEIKLYLGGAQDPFQQFKPSLIQLELPNTGFLKLTDRGVVTLSHSEGASLSLKEDNCLLQSDSSHSLKMDNNLVEIKSGSVGIRLGQDQCQVKRDNITLGDKSQAKLTIANGKILLG